MTCSQYQYLQREFPKTLHTLEQTFTPKLSESVTDARGHNPAGYVLFQLRRAHRHAVSTHGEVRGCLAHCDIEFAREVAYHAERHTQFRNLIPALGACWYNRVHERGEQWRELSGSTPDTQVHSHPPAHHSTVHIGAFIHAAVAKTGSRVAGA